tara:strand:+ start:4483 stop:5520 length:1038 start_codon:yes stop_codon:yes gene_type:complete
MSNSWFTTLLTSNKNFLNRTKSIEQVNSFLVEYDWFFIAPTFLIGLEIEMIQKIAEEDVDVKKRITKILAQRFYNLDFRTDFIEGYCIRCNHIKPFIESIENSMILCFQYDYEGAIKTLIPTIEGIMRKYLKSNGEEGHISYQTIKKSFQLLEEDMVISARNGYENFDSGDGRKVSFNKEEIEELSKIDTQLYRLWFSFMEDFIHHSLYKHTQGEPLTNEINRHSILHEFGDKIDYTLDNYLKIYFVIDFLCWAFIRVERKSIMNEAPTKRFLEKKLAYQRIIENANRMLIYKAVLKKDYSIQPAPDIYEPVSEHLFPKRYRFWYELGWELDRKLLNKIAKDEKE